MMLVETNGAVSATNYLMEPEETKPPIAGRLRYAREAAKLTQKQLADLVGMKGQTSIGEIERGNSARPSKLRELAKALSKSEDWLLGIIPFGSEAVQATELRPGRRPGSPAPPREIELAPDAPAFDRIGGARDVPEHGIAVGGEDGDFTLNGEVVGYVTRPLSLRGRNVFAVRVKGSSMVPRFDEGDVLYVERNREPAIGDDGIFEMKPTDEWEAGHAFVKQLVAKGMGLVKVKQFNPEKTISYRREEIARMFRIVPRNELLSV